MPTDTVSCHALPKIRSSGISRQVMGLNPKLYPRSALTMVGLPGKPCWVDRVYYDTRGLVDEYQITGRSVVEGRGACENCILWVVRVIEVITIPSILPCSYVTFSL